MGRRHWKQRWDPNADFIFLRRLNLGIDPDKPFVGPGDPVPKGDARLGRGRLKKWWDAEIIALADWEEGSQSLNPELDAKVADANAPIELVPVATSEPSLGVTLEANESGLLVTRPDGAGNRASLQLGSLEQALHFAQTGEVPAEEEAEAVVVTEQGGGWYEVQVEGEPEPRKVQGREALEQLLKELGAAS